MLADHRMGVILCIAQLTFGTLSLQAQIPLFSDTFENGSVTDSEAVTGFWTPTIATTNGSVVESGGKLILTAGGPQSDAGVKGARLFSGPRCQDYNFFRRKLRFVMDATVSGDYGGFQFAVTGTSSGNLVTNYVADDSFVVSVSYYNTVSIGSKEDRANVSAMDVNRLVNEASIPSVMTRIELTLDATDYTLVVYYQGGSKTFTGQHKLIAAQWGVDGKTAFQIELLRASGGSVGAGMTVTSVVDNFTVSNCSPSTAFFEDYFGNGLPTGSESEADIWTATLPNTSTCSESTGALKLTATNPGLGTEAAYLCTPVQSRFNFFDHQLKISYYGEIEGTASQPWLKHNRVSFCSEATRNAAANDAISLGIRGEYYVMFGTKVDNSATDAIDGNSSANYFPLEGANLQPYAGNHRFNLFELKLNNKRYELRALSPARDLGMVRFSGAHKLERSKWGANGDSSLVLEAVRWPETAAFAGSAATAVYDDLRVESDNTRILDEPFYTFTATYSTPDYGYGAGTQSGPYRLWIPATEPVIRGIIFAGPGTGGRTHYTVSDPILQEAARAIGFGIIGYDTASRMNLDTSDYPEPIKSAVQAVLNRAAEVSGHPEIANAPLCATGVSQGAFDSCYLARNWPERVITIVPHCGGEWYSFTMTPAIRKVPVYFVPGSVDGNSLTSPLAMITDFNIWRSQNGLVAYAVDWNVGHSWYGNVGWESTAAWFVEIANLRYPRPMTPSLKHGQAPTLLDLDESKAWLGERADFSGITTPSVTQKFATIAPIASFSGTATASSWLPNESMARMYRAMTSTDRATRAAIPTHSPVRIVSPAQYSDPFILGKAILIDVDPRDFDNTNALASVDFYDGDQWLGADSSGPAWSWSYTPSTTGLHSLSVVATDVLGNKRDAFRVIHVIPADFPPVARHYAYALATGLSKGGTLVASDPEGNAITNYSIVQQPSHGTLAVDPQSGAFTYQSTNGYSGADHFAYTATDGTLSSAVATVSFSVVGLQVGNIDSISATPGASEGQIALTWSAATNAERYSIERSLTNSGGFYHIATVSAPLVSYTDSVPNLTQSYYYRAKAIYQGTESGYSAIASSLPNNPYSTVGSISSITAVPGPRVGRITLTWSAATNATGYRIERADAPNSGVFVTTKSILAPTTFHTEMVGTVPDLISFRVLPYNPAYTGTYSATASAIAYQPRTIETWVYTNFYSDVPIKDVTGDLDIANSDRVTNLMRYALGYSVYNDDGDRLNLTPTDLPYVREQSISGENYLTCVLTRNKDADDITYRVQVASDPAGPWSDIDPLNAANQVGVTDNTPTASQQIIVVRDTQPTSAADKRFMRVKVSHP